MSCKQYQNLQLETDQITSQLTERYQPYLQCGAGCSGCCQHHLSLFPVEAANVKNAIQNLSPEKQAQVRAQAQEVIAKEIHSESVTCPLLIEDNCSVYEARPIICRTQGLPLLYEAEDGEHEIDFCPLNFNSDEAIAALDEAHVVPLDPINLKLAIVNIEFCRERAIDPNHRIKIADLC